MARIKKKPNPPRRCIFCGGTPISKEHVWAEWMRDYLPRGQGHQIIQSGDLNSPVHNLRTGPLNRKGDARSQKLQVVCRPCNNEWMSVLQGRTKDVLLPLLLREKHDIDGTNHVLLANWATMFTMVYETCYPTSEQHTTTKQQHVLFKTEQKPPQYWMFWCAPYDGRSSPVFHTGFGSGRGQDDPNTEHVGKGSLTICGAGAICFAVFGVDSEYGFQAFSKLITMIVEQVGFVQLWPTLGASISVLGRRLSPLSNRDLSEIHGVLRSSLVRDVAASRRRDALSARGNL